MSLGRKIVFVLCLIVFVGSAGMLLNYFLTGMREQSSLEDLAKLKTEREDMKTDKGTVIGKYVDLYEANSDIIGWITVDGTKIDYPVMQTQDDPEVYLRRNFQKEHATAGVPFMDASSDIFDIQLPDLWAQYEEWDHVPRHAQVQRQVFLPGA